MVDRGSMSHRATVHQLEADFADAMTRMYAVGNGLARLRSELDRETVMAAGSQGFAPATEAAPPPGAPPAGPTLPAGSTVPAATQSAPPRGTGAPPGTDARSVAGATTGMPVASGSSAAEVGPASGTPSTPVPQPPETAPAGPYRFSPRLGRLQPALPGIPWYRKEGAVTRALALTGAVVTLAGIAMFLVLVIQQGWFGPRMRVTAGALLAAALVAIGVRNGEAERRVRSVVGSAPVALVATGAAAAYLDVVALTSRYGWLQPQLGLLLAGLVALAGLRLARRWLSELLAVIIVVGAAVLAPVVAQEFGWVVSAFLGVLCLVAWWAGTVRTWPYLTIARVLPVTLSLLAGASDSPVGSADARGHLLVALVLLVATLVTSTLAVRRDPRDVASSIAVALLSAALLACSAPLAEPSRTSVLTLAAVVLLVTATGQTRPPVGPVAGHLLATVSVAGTVAAVLAIMSGAPERFVTTGLVLLAVAQVVVAGVTRSRLALYLAGGTSAVALLSWLQHPLAALSEERAATHDMSVALVDSILVAALAVAGLWASGQQRGLRREVRLGATIVSWVVGLTASATIMVALGTLIGSSAGDIGLGFRIGHAVATVTWMVAAGWLLVRGLARSRDADLTLRTGLVLSGISVAKLFLFDYAALSGIVRSMAFILTGLLLLGTASAYTRVYQRSRTGS
jgi:uncharacterized membrane protein